MVKVNGKPMLEYLIQNLIDNDITDIIICTGFESNKIIDFCKLQFPNINFKFVENKDFKTTNNMYSLYLAKNYFTDDLILMNADLIYDKEIISKLKTQNGSCVAVDKGQYNEESMKIIVKDNFVKSISKKIAPEEAYGCSIDVYKICKEDLKKIEYEMKKIIEDQKDLNQWTELMLDNLFKTDILKAKPLDITSHKWFEIDDHNDLKKAEELFKNKN